MALLLVGLVVIVMLASIISFWTTQTRGRQYISIENLFTLMLLYLTMMIGFGLIYAWMEMNGYEAFVKSLGRTNGEFVHILHDSLYFSAITLLSVGYGDIIPIGTGRWIAMLEALLGYIIPAAFVARFVMDSNEK
ncbi:potassium channel family protein [Anoxybacteroides tepidamans]|uniref:potassium channel family protein n=1 Tax=Anoxybacteroides tepidamans TaxID=265948 RepID=UPI0005524BDB|nr:potassium channel family protein [Anoxybacillus tepidamans]